MKLVESAPTTVRETDLAKFLPDESISTTNFCVAESVACFGFVHDNVRTVLFESEDSGATVATEADNTGAFPLAKEGRSATLLQAENAAANAMRKKILDKYFMSLYLDH